MRDKFLRLQRDKENTDQQSQKEREEFQAAYEELKIEQHHLREPSELIEKQTKDYLKEKNSELFDALIKQERLTEKYKWELKKTGETLEQEMERFDQMRKENNHMKNFIWTHHKVSTKSEKISKKRDKSPNDVKMPK